MKHLKDLKNWKDGINQVVCGDCLKLMEKMEDNCVDLVLTDPPYNMGKEFKNDNFENWNDFTKWSEKWIKESERILKNNGNLIFFGEFFMITKVLKLFSKKMKFNEIIIWYKKNGGYSRNHEIITRLNKKIYIGFGEYIYKKRQEKKLTTKQIKEKMGLKIYKGCGNAGWLFFETGNIPLFKNYKNLKKILNLDNRFDEYVRLNDKNLSLVEKGGSDVWEIPVEIDKKKHPTQKPITLISKIIHSVSDKNDIILDPFMGSWTTARACKDLGRDFIGCELSEEYCKIGEDRLKQEVLL